MRHPGVWAVTGPVRLSQAESSSLDNVGLAFVAGTTFAYNAKRGCLQL
jgi:hypothetical protein